MSGLTWRDRFGEEATCIRCLESKDITDLDRLFWCRECRKQGTARAKRVGWIVGAAMAAILTLWILIVIRPSTLILGGWIATVFAAFWLTARIAREVAYGVARYRNRRAVEARPPVEPPDAPESDSDADADRDPDSEADPTPREENGG